jgi:predicted ArsR family transcriptional regulator
LFHNLLITLNQLKWMVEKGDAVMSKNQEFSTRQIILTLIKTKGSQSVNELAKQLGITEMAVRRHLNTLERDGLTQSTLVRQAMGRPTHVYTLTDSADELFPKNYHKLTLDLLEELSAEDGSETVSKLFEGRKRKLLRQYEGQMQGKDLQERVSILAKIQNDGGYMVEYQQDDEGNYVFNEYNCPIAQVANQYNQACQCELALFEALLDTNVERTECLAKDGSKCTYMIEAQGSNKD